MSLNPRISALKKKVSLGVSALKFLRCNVFQVLGNMVLVKYFYWSFVRKTILEVDDRSETIVFLFDKTSNQPVFGTEISRHRDLRVPQFCFFCSATFQHTCSFEANIHFHTTRRSQGSTDLLLLLQLQLSSAQVYSSEANVHFHPQ